jgi:hypothetical protein
MRLIAAGLAFTIPSLLFAAGTPEVAIIPLGVAQIPKGVSQPRYVLPSGPNGPLPEAIVMVASRPRTTNAQQPVVTPAHSTQDTGRIPATLKFTVAGKELPPWILQDTTTAYVINLAAIKSNPLYSQAQLELKIELIAEVEGVGLPMFGMPDPLLLNETLSGPLNDFITQSVDPDVKAYFTALAADFASRKQQPGDWQPVRDAYAKLATSKNDTIARLALRGLRKTAYDLRPHNPSGNFNERYRWGLYLQQCGLFAPAFAEFDQCRVIDAGSVDSCFRAGELIERINGGIVKTMDYMERTGEAAAFANPATWYSLVIVERKRADRALTSDEIKAVKINWQLVQADVWGATEGRLKIVNSFYEIVDGEPRKLVEYAPGVEAPGDDIVETRGWFDSVIFVRPRLSADAGKGTMTVGGDRGPKGAALSVLYHDAPWAHYYKAWFEHFAWAVNVGEQFEGLPGGDGQRLCGTQPPASDASGCRAALRYYMSNAEYDRPRICDEPRPGEYIHLWKIEGPFPIAPEKTAESPTHHLSQLLNPSGDARTIYYDSSKDFINLKRIFGKAGPALARATTWVFSPDDQSVRMWIGQNDGASVTLNGRRIHEGKYFSAGNYEDRNITDMIAGWAPLKRGWNELSVVVEGLPAPRDMDWGFSIRMCTSDNQPVSGIAYLNKAPADGLAPQWRPPLAGSYHDWQDVKEDFRERLLNLSAADLQKITGIDDLAIANQLSSKGGYVALVTNKKPLSPYRAAPASWQPDKDRDDDLNNLLDWMRESIAAIRFEKNGARHDLLLLKPEAIDAFLLLLKEPASAEKLFKGVPISKRILGYVLTKGTGVELPVFIVDSLLSDEKYPLDDDDLLEPISPTFIPNKARARAPSGPPAMLR